MHSLGCGGRQAATLSLRGGSQKYGAEREIDRERQLCRSRQPRLAVQSFKCRSNADSAEPAVPCGRFGSARTTIIPERLSLEKKRALYTQQEEPARNPHNWLGSKNTTVVRCSQRAALREIYKA